MIYKTAISTRLGAISAAASFFASKEYTNEHSTPVQDFIFTGLKGRRGGNISICYWEI